ncbi:MAG: IPTL-CTERM sorting domain-containing protein [Phycisphaerae bacterium]|nr:IPTL-CTERM sorting domain-containing protein [Phycisphaerae bacterium]
MRIRNFLLAGILSLAVAGAASAATHVVTQSGLSFSPPNVDVLPGDTVQWVHTGGIHTVTSGTPCTSDGRFDMALTSGTVQYVIPGGEPAGTIPYFCTPHCAVGMTGTITVGEPEPIPTVSEWGLAAMSLLVLVAGTAVVRFRPA